MTEPSMLDNPEVQKIIHLSQKEEKAISRSRQTLLEEAYRHWKFRSTEGIELTLRKLTWPEAVRIIFAKMPEQLSDAMQSEHLAITIEDQLKSHEVACEALAAANLEGLTAAEIARVGRKLGGKAFVDEANLNLMEESGLTPKAVERLDFFRKLKRRVRVGFPVLRKSP